MILKAQTLMNAWRASVYEQNKEASNLSGCLLTLLEGAPKHIFEPGCGCGKTLFPLSQAGHTVVGMDKDENMLSYAQRKAALSPMHLICADFLVAPWPRDFDAILVGADLMHSIITDWEYKQAQKQLIMKSAASLKKGGLLILDFNCPSHLACLAEDAHETLLLEGTDENGTFGKMYIKHTEADEKTRLLKSRLLYALMPKDMKPITFEQIIVRHILTLEETTAWLYRAGFCIEALYGSHDFKPFNEKNRRCVISARKE